MKTRELTCIVCPLGCGIKVEVNDDGAVVSVTGNTCPRGKAYAEKECVNPERTVTTTMRTDTGTVIPVKTDRPIPKEKMFDAMKIIKPVINEKDEYWELVSIGDILIKDVFGSNIVAVKNAD